MIFIKLLLTITTIHIFDGNYQTKIMLVVNGELRPPKVLPRVVAGFYSFHPAYDTDKPAKILTTKTRSTIPMASVNDVRLMNVLPQQNQLSQMKPAKTQSKKKKSKKKGRKAKKNRQQKSKPMFKTVNRPIPKYNHQWTHWFQLVRTYVLMAQNLAIHYGMKYDYPVDILYNQILRIMFE